VYVSVCLKDDFTTHPPGYDYDHPRLQVGLIGPGATDVTWGTTLVGNEVGGQYPETAPPSDDGAYVAVGGWARGVALVDVAARRELWTKVPGSNSVQYVAFSPDSRIVYAGGTEAAVYAMDVKTGNVLSKWYASKSGAEEYGHSITCLAVSPDGRWVAAATGPEGLVFIGSTATNKCVKILNHGMGTVFLVHFSPDSKALATFVPGTLKIWNVSQWDKTPPPTAPAQTQPAATQRATSKNGAGRP
jgi:WD40 repeat protein